jgi:crotonobetainyl-CoA:carnitine CoA-transferase CaiB-like acyl-CoA transferase
MSWPEGTASGQGPLQGVKVLDLSRILAGPTTTTILSDLGADVVKVERPGSGDETRRWGPPWAPNKTAAYFYVCNRGKRSVTFDMREEDDLSLVFDLIADADVLLENFLPGALDRMGLTREAIRERNAAIVHATISGYGNQSSKSSWPALDFVVQAHTGILGVTGSDPEHPVKAGVPVADLSAGLYATIGILAALRQAEATGKGSHIEVALADSCTSLLSNQAMNVLMCDTDPKPAGNTHPSVAPYQTLMAQDRLIAVAASSEVQFERMCKVLGAEELVQDERFATNGHRIEHRVELTRLLGEKLSVRPAAEWMRELNEAGVAAAVVNSPREALLEDPDIRERLVTEVSDGEHTFPQLRVPIRIDGEPLEPSAAPPALGSEDAAIRAALQRANGRV